MLRKIVKKRGIDKKTIFGKIDFSVFVIFRNVSWERLEILPNT